MENTRGKSTAKSDAALRDIRKALERTWPALRRLPPKGNAWVQTNVAKGERAKFKRFLLTVQHLGDVDLKRAARRFGVSKEVLDEWMNTPEISKCINRFLSNGRRRRANAVVGWAKFHFKMGSLTLKAPLTADGEIHPDGVDYGNMLPLGKKAALSFERPRSFRGFC